MPTLIAHFSVSRVSPRCACETYYEKFAIKNQITVSDQGPPFARPAPKAWRHSARACGGLQGASLGIRPEQIPLGARILHRGTDSALGAISGGIAAAAVFGALFLMYGEVPVSGAITAIFGIYFAYRIAA